MIGRVTQGYIVNDFNSTLYDRQSAMQNMQKQLASGYRVNLASDDPVAAINYMDYDSRLNEIKTYKNIIENVKGKINVADSALDSVTSIIQRARELAVQGANGVYTREERQNMAVEIDQLARELIQQANSSFKGNALFGGTMTDETPFKTNIQTDKTTGLDFLEDVRYIGNNQTQLAEVENGEKVDVTQPGNQIFWANNMEIYSTISSNGYTAAGDSKIYLDGVEIEIKAGDNLEIIANKMNNSGAAVQASIQTKDGESYFGIVSTTPHQISLMDAQGGSTLQDMGLIDHGMYPPNNYSPAAKVYTGSIFDVMIDLRKSLISDNIFQIGGTALSGIDSSLSNILKFRSHIGAVSERLDKISDRFLNDEVYITDEKQTSVGTDIAECHDGIKDA